jgi:predicted transcriptional regulator
VTPNFLVCLETGSRQVLLRRHLRETLRMTPQEYRDRWGLPSNYPMAAANYLRRRQAVAHMTEDE